MAASHSRDAGTRDRASLPAPRRSKVRFAPTSFYAYGKKDVIRPLPCSSFPTATRCAGLAVGRPPCGRFFAEPKISGLTVPSKKKDTTFRRVLLFGFRWKLKCSGEVNSPISAPSAAALRRLRSETRLRAQSAKVLPPAKRLYGAGAPPARWAGNNGGELAASASCIPETKTIC